MKKIIFAIVTVIVFSSCVSTKRYNNLLTTYNDTTERLNTSQIQLAETSHELSSVKKDLNDKEKELSQLFAETERLKRENALNQKEIEELNKQLTSSNSKINEVLNDKSKHLSELSNSLNAKEQELGQKERNLDSLQREMQASREQIKKMKAQLDASDKKLAEIHSKLKKALLGFTDKGLTIENKNGKVYVSMDEKLLFSSGSWEVSAEGEKALAEIAVVLSNNQDVDIMVEGHTDNVPLKGKNQIKDNWDLSVMRATSITKILLNGTGISPKRIIPCGRSEYMPVADNKTEEHRAKNRRTEIILSPKVSELIDILK
ncbi:MAG: OmpA family protein [Bacteroidales bacterium]|nr:OmpA family protein [Bacteroidales bacterium]